MQNSRQFRQVMKDNGPKHEDRLPSMAGSGIHAGFPSPAQDYMERCIDLNRELVRHPAATFYGRAVGDSMIDAGVEDGDILVIDKSLEPEDGAMAVCFVDGEFTLKYISKTNPDTGKPEQDALWLVPANKSYKPMKVSSLSDFTVWGIVTYIIKKVRSRSRGL